MTFVSIKYINSPGLVLRAFEVFVAAHVGHLGQSFREGFTPWAQQETPEQLAVFSLRTAPVTRSALLQFVDNAPIKIPDNERSHGDPVLLTCPG
jgi:hypothetical protein